MSTTTPQKMVGYVRVSRVNGREGESFISPDLQREKIDGWAKLKGIEVVYVEPDLDESGGSQDRPGLQKAVEMVEAGEVDGIVCAYLSRFARNVAGALADIERIHNAGGSVAFVQENLDPTTPMGKAMLTVLLAFATLERDNVAQAWLDSRAAAVSRGVYVQAAPFGYLKDDDGRLAEHPDEAPIIRETYRLAADDGLRAAAGHLASRTTIKDGRRVLRAPGDAPSGYLRPAELARVLDSRVYLGEQHAGELVNAKNHPALVSRDVWERAQRQPTFRRAGNNFYPLSGLLTCEHCGDLLKGWGKDRHGKMRYVCRGWTRKQCPSPMSIEDAALTAHLLDFIRSSYAEDGTNTLLVGRDDSVDLDALRDDLDAAEAERTAYALDTSLRAALGDVAYVAGARARSEAVAAAQKAYREAANLTTTRVAHVPLEALDGLAGEDLSTVFAAAFDRIIVGPAIVNGKRQRVPDRVRVVLHSESESVAAA